MPTITRQICWINTEDSVDRIDWLDQYKGDFSDLNPSKWRFFRLAKKVYRRYSDDKEVSVEDTMLDWIEVHPKDNSAKLAMKAYIEMGKGQKHLLT